MSLFAVIAPHLLPLTNYLVNEQYVLVQPIASKFTLVIQLLNNESVSI